MKKLILTAAILTISACATPGPIEYGPANADGFGYSDTPIETDRYRIVYRGSAGMPPELVEDFAFRRAAERTSAAGYDWFRVVARDVEHDVRGGVDVGAGFGSGRFGRRSGVSVGVGGNFGRVGAREFYTARIEILMQNGETPDDRDAYDAGVILELSQSTIAQ